MNEQQYIEKVQKLKSGKVNLNSIKRYAAQLRAGKPLSVSFFNAEPGVGTPDRSVLELSTPEQLEKLNQWQGVTELSDQERSALRLLLKIHGIEPVGKRAALNIENARNEVGFRGQREESEREEIPLSLFGLLEALRESTKNRRNQVKEHTYSLLMGALLLNDKYEWKNDSTKRHLRSWGKEYEEYALVIAENLQSDLRRIQVKEAMLKAFRTMEDDTNEEDPRMDVELRLDVARACLNLEKKMEIWKVTQEKPEEEWGQYEGSEAQLVLQQLASMYKGTIGKIYRGISDIDVVELVIQLFSLAIDAAEGRFPPAPDAEERMAKISAEERALLSVIGCGPAMKRKHWLMKEIQPMLINLLLAGVLVPEEGVCRYDELRFADRIVPILLPKAERDLLGTSVAEELGFSQNDILISMDRDMAILGADPQKMEFVWRLLCDLLKEANTDQIDPYCDIAISEHLEDLLCNPFKPTALRSEIRYKLIRYVVKHYWTLSEARDSEVGILALDKLLWWLEKAPNETRKSLHSFLKGSSFDLGVLLVNRCGTSMIEAELHGACASRCLHKAQEERQVLTIYNYHWYWAVCAIQHAKSAKQQFQKLNMKESVQLMESVIESAHWILEDKVHAMIFIEDGEKEKPWYWNERNYDYECVKTILSDTVKCDDHNVNLELLASKIWGKIPLHSSTVGWTELVKAVNDMEYYRKYHTEASADEICNHLIHKYMGEHDEKDRFLGKSYLGSLMLKYADAVDDELAKEASAWWKENDMC